MRIAILGDIHANLPALRAVMDDAASIGCDAAWSVGDVVGRGPHPNEVVSELQRQGIPTVQGNWDEAVAMERDAPGCVWEDPAAEAIGLESLAWTVEALTDDKRSWLRKLPATHRFAIDGRSVLLFHGTPLRQAEYLWENRPSRHFARIAEDEADDLFAFGHTHESFHRSLMGSHFVAVGSVGCSPDPQPHARYSVVYLTATDLVVGFRNVGYDHVAVVRDRRDSGLDPSLLFGPAPRPIARSASVGLGVDLGQPGAAQAG
jgi:predicted phosphodiesterase